MYLPAQFQERDTRRLEAFLETHGFATLVSSVQGAPFASHLPLLFERGANTSGKLLGHMARANPQWQEFEQAQTVLAVFHGPHAYVSPSWYRATGVPTWNYAVVHVYGRARLIEDQATLRSVIERLTAYYEAHNPDPWRIDLPDDRYRDLLDKIVGFEIDILRMEAKFKLSQNRSDADREGVIAGLRATGNPSDAALAGLMASGLPD